MIINRLIAKNWRNFRQIDVPLRERQFIVGPNASGKSNLLDIFRFLRDIVKIDGGGFQKATKVRGGVSKIRCLAAPHDAEVSIELHIAESADTPATWRYTLGFLECPQAHQHTYITHERVWKGDELLLLRPDNFDKDDPTRLTQTALEQSATNAKFREISSFLRNVTYLHLVPQFIQYANAIQGKVVEEDPFGQMFLDRIASVHPSTRRSRLKKIEHALKIAIPHFEKLEFVRDKATGKPHLEAHSTHWRSNKNGLREDHFSDGMLRLVGLFWSLLENDSVILLEEPELSLNLGIISQLAPMISIMGRNRRCQVLVSTQSDILLTEPGIDGREVLMLIPDRIGTLVKPASDFEDVCTLLKNGFTVGEIVLTRNAEQLSLIE